MIENKEIRVPVKNGVLVAGRNGDPDYDGIYIVFETNEGDIIDLVVTECKAENNQKVIDIYSFEDAYTEDFTRKASVNIEDIYNALNG